ncbi:MAG: hypothetical protein CME62_06625 [Halobacteriovoraceae bacterium]|nr:hypothetical protein [Halobacteriovoraceae bacterium]
MHSWFLLAFLSFNISAQITCQGDNHCASQMLRVDINNNLFNEENISTLRPALEQLASPEVLPSLIEQEYQLMDIPFPQRTATCLREKAENSPGFENIDCHERGLCQREDLDPNIKEQLCFALPCAIFEGNLMAGSCQDVEMIYTTELGFENHPLDLKKARFTPTSIDINQSEVNMCFTINELELSMGMELTYDSTGTAFPNNKISLSNINANLTEPRNVCIKAKLDVTSPSIISDIEIIPQDDGFFITTDVIRAASAALRIDGLSGYSPENIADVQAELLPRLIHPIRQSVEEAVKESLGDVFEEELTKLVAPLSPSENRSTFVHADDFMTQMGMANQELRQKLDKWECSQIVASNQTIPQHHNCLADGMGFNRDMTAGDMVGRVESLREDVVRHVIENDISSKYVENRIQQIKELIPQDVSMISMSFFDSLNSNTQNDLRRRQETSNNFAVREIDRLIERIQTGQTAQVTQDFIELTSNIEDYNMRSIGVSLPGFCDVLNPSPHAGRSMPGCPAQIYTDLEQMNVLIAKLWENGALCSRSSGAYVPVLDEQGNQRYHPDDIEAEGPVMARKGCMIDIDPKMSCFIKEPPTIEYNAQKEKYSLDIYLQHCYRGPETLVFGRFGGDFEATVDFTPSACGNGDFCISEAEVDWEVVPGTERYALKQTSFFHGKVMEALNDNIAKATGETIQLPMASVVPGLENMPLRAEGRVDTGPGFFGICMELASEEE